MGAIARSAANNITTSGVFTSGAITNSSVTGITVLANASDGITLISSQTASNSASISFTSGLTSTYKAYKFVFSNINRGNGNTSEFGFNFSTDSGSNYNVAKTTTYFIANHNEADSVTSLVYRTGNDLAQGTGLQHLIGAGDGFGTSTASSGTLTLFNPSSTTYVKHFISTTNHQGESAYTINSYIAGYGNTTSAINAVRFQKESGNFSGTIYLYGIK